MRLNGCPAASAIPEKPISGAARRKKPEEVDLLADLSDQRKHDGRCRAEQDEIERLPRGLRNSRKADLGCRAAEETGGSRLARRFERSAKTRRSMPCRTG